MEKEKRSFEEAIRELEEIVSQIERGDLSLDQSIELFQKGIELSKYCTKRLDEVERKITVLIEDDRGNIHEEPMPEG
ncbi:MAG: exodeoxyribonuclease VII small subunit [Acetivibrionales bacterium]|jgi:exodeoxyribonuclease VII small subunit